MDDVPNSVLLLLGGLGMASLVVLAVAAQRRLRGRPVFAAVAPGAEGISEISIAVAGAWIAMAMYSALRTSATEIPVPSVSGIRNSVLFNVMLFGIVFLPLAVGSPTERRRLGFRLDQCRHQLADGVVGFLASLAPVALVFGVTFSLRNENNAHALLRLLESDQSFAAVFWIVVSAAVMAPLVEELIYRVVLQTWLEQRMPPRGALVVAAVVFSAVHRFPDALPLFPLALVLGYLYQQRRSFLAIVVVHSLFNATNLAVLLLSLKQSN